MSIDWKNLKKDTIAPVANKNSREESPTGSSGCTAYFGVDAPVCTNRGKYKNERKVCWDTIKNLRYDGKKLLLDNKSYKLFLCKKCEEYFIEESNRDLGDEELFTCFECNKLLRT